MGAVAAYFVKISMPYHRFSDCVPLPIFKQIVADSLNPRILALSRSGPRGLPEFPIAQGSQPFPIPPFRELVLWDLDLDYAKALVQYFDMPNLKLVAW